MATKKKEKSSTAAVWKSLPAPVVPSTIGDLVHFSAKVVNSNTPAGGIRVSEEMKLDLPYVSVRTIGPSLVPLDYVKNSGSTATVAKQLEAVVQDTVSAKFTNVPEEDLLLYRTSLAKSSGYHEVGIGSVGKRLRQIVVQDMDGNDVALTPLTSAGFGALLEDRLQQEIADSDPNTYRYRRRGFLGVGGANPQNVGRHIRSLQRPLWFQAPTIDQGLREALALYHRGISLRASPAMLDAYYQWRQKHLDANAGVMPSTLETRETEIGFLLKIIAGLMNRAGKASEQLQRYREQLPGQECTSPDLPAELRALLDPALRYSGWNRALARRIHLGLLEQKIRVSGTWKTIGIGQEESSRWLSVIEEALA